MNSASYLPKRAANTPHQDAIFFKDKKLTYEELNHLCDDFAEQLASYGVQKGHRMILMVRPSFEFVALTFALLKLGAGVILIDPGIGKKYLKTCIQTVEPHGFIGIAKAHLLRLLWPSSFQTSQINLVIGKGASCLKYFGFSTLEPNSQNPPSCSLAPTEPRDTAAIIFTTGSTGIPKGVVYTHGMFEAQIHMLKTYYQIQEGEVDLPTFPLFALFSVAMGTPCIIPDMDPTKPALVNPQNIIGPIQKYHVTTSFGSPALWNRVTHFCIEHKITLPSIRRILIAGAPVPPNLLERFQKILSHDAEVYTPYGATEALPVTSIGSKDILTQTMKLSHAGKGTCVGKPFPGITVAIIKIIDAPIAQWHEDLKVTLNTIGEIVVQGENVTHSYFHRPHETTLAKIKDANGKFWHRMGDVGYLDTQNRLWFCGRKAHRVTTYNQVLFTIPCESIFNQHPAVFRSALVGVGKKPVIIIEPQDKKNLKDKKDQLKLTQELLVQARQFSHTQEIQDILYHPSFPVDIRHNAKINREKLAQWARGQLS